VTSSPVTVANSAPVFSTNFQDRSDAVGSSPGLDADAADADGDALTYSATGLPGGMTIAPASGVISGTLTAGSVGAHSVTLTVSDGSASDTDTFTWTVTSAANTAPVVDSVTVTPASPTTGQTVTANVTSHDAEGNPLTTSYQWTRNGTNISGATGATLDLATAGNGDKGDLIRVIATVNDGSLNSAPVTSSPVTVANTPPVATVGLAPSSPDTAATLTATATRSDADAADAISLHYVWRVNGTTRKTTDTTALTDTFDLSVAGNGDAGDTVSVEVTPNDGTANGTPVSTQVVVASSVTVFASDSFSRALTNTWGSADVGGAYTLQGTAADYDTNGATGTVVLGTGAVNRSAVLASVLARDVDISFRVALDKIPVGGSLWSYGLIRRINASNEYRAVLRTAPGGGVYIGASTVLNGSEASIGTEVRVTALTATPGAFIRMRAQFSGANPTTIRMRAWADGTTEPTTWQYTATNTAAALQVAGAVGIRNYLGSATTNTPFLVTLDDLVAISIAGP
jgi:large repetitive protein